MVVSDTDVMHEIFGDGVVYVDPNDCNIALSDFPEISEAQVSGLLAKYSWKKSAETLLELLKSMERGQINENRHKCFGVKSRRKRIWYRLLYIQNR